MPNFTSLYFTLQATVICICMLLFLKKNQTNQWHIQGAPPPPHTHTRGPKTFLNFKPFFLIFAKSYVFSPTGGLTLPPTRNPVIQPLNKRAGYRTTGQAW